MLCDPGLAPTFSDDVNNIVAVHINCMYYVPSIKCSVSHHPGKEARYDPFFHMRNGRLGEE